MCNINAKADATETAINKEVKKPDKHDPTVFLHIYEDALKKECKKDTPY